MNNIYHRAAIAIKHARNGTWPDDADDALSLVLDELAAEVDELEHTAHDDHSAFMWASLAQRINAAYLDLNR